MKLFHTVLCICVFLFIPSQGISPKNWEYAKRGAMIGAIPGSIFLFSEQLHQQSGQIMRMDQKILIFLVFEAVAAGTGVAVGNIYSFFDKKLQLHAFLKLISRKFC